MRSLPLNALGFCCLMALTAPLVAQSQMEKQFVQPPDSAKPRVWWHWLSGNVTKEGITADLEWMHRVGIGGFQMFDGNLSTPRFVDHPVLWMTPEWKDAWHHAAAEANRLHLEMGMAASGGWSETAGPWVKPQQGMKKYVWSETAVSGPKRFHGQLIQPPDTVGRFQTMPTAPDMAFPTPTDLPGTKPPLPSTRPPLTPRFYRDVKAVAYKLPSTKFEPRPTITTNSPTPLDLSLLDGHDLSKTTILTIPQSAEGWVQFAYTEPVKSYAMTIGVGVAGGFLAHELPVGVLESSLDGKTWTKLVDLPGSPQSPTGSITMRTYAYSPVTASFYRLRVQRPVPSGVAMALGAPPEAGVTLSELTIQTSPRVNHWEDKAAFGIFVPDKNSSTPSVPANVVIAQNSVVDVTGKVQTDGTLDWEVPAGDWVVLRFGYSLTGEKNHPATPAATGLEVDKLSHDDVASYIQTYSGMIAGVAGDLDGKSFRNFLLDSWEAGNANWTERMGEEFERRRGYSLTPFLPVLTGHVVGSPAASEAILWDFRRTLAEMLAENHYGAVAAAILPSGISLYAEAMGTDLPTTGDGLLNKGSVTVPMGEFWTPAPGEHDLPSHIADTREAASAAHIYGKPIAAAESFTTTIGMPGWAQSPFYLKPLADENFARGINRIIIHTSDHQPFVDDAHKPGLTLGPFGQNYTRNITWAEQAVAWNTYLARTSYLLQQGSYVADVAYFYGEGAPSVAPYWKPVLPAPPTHYGFDYVNADVLLHHTSVQNGRLTFDSGMSYKLLVVPTDTKTMTVELLTKLQSLVSSGATLLAPRPERSPSFADASAGKQYARLTAALWGDDAASAHGHLLGNGRVYEAVEIEPLLARLEVAPDFSYTAATGQGPELTRPMPVGDSSDDLVYLHRRTSREEIYFVATQKLHAFDTTASFRSEGRVPTLWDPITGQRRAVSYESHNGITTVPLHFNAASSIFVVFGAADKARHATIGRPVTRTIADLSHGWRINFPNAETNVAENDLRSWTESSKAAVKYFSGTATYTRSFNLSAVDASGHLWLDFGDVREIAEVSINGSRLNSILWTPPYCVSTAHLLHAGHNTIAVKVTNLWPNRMIGDEQPGVTHRQTFTGLHAFTMDSPLLPSGMLGPITLFQRQ